MATSEKLTSTTEVIRSDRSSKAIQLGSLLTVYCDNTALSHIFLSLNESMCGADLQTHMVVPNCERSLRRSNLTEGIPQWLKKLCYRSSSAPRAITERRFLKDVEQFDAIYLWPDSSQKILRAVKQKGKPVFAERINCHTGKAKQILDEAYSRLGVEPQHLITPEMIQCENEDMAISDFIFCPSPEVKKSFQEAGIPEQKLISASYGWSPKRFPNLPVQQLQSQPESKPITVLFVGRLCVRKGTHLLLRAWEKAGIEGKLMLCGRMEPAIAQTCGSILSRPDVVYREYNSDISYAYAAADVFAFPSLEEGSPLVTYEAMAHGLPALVSPMGAGGIVRDGIDGMVIPPYDEERWIEALQQLAESAELRTRLGESSRQQANEFTWEKAAIRRALAIVERLQALEPA